MVVAAIATAKIAARAKVGMDDERDTPPDASDTELLCARAARLVQVALSRSATRVLGRYGARGRPAACATRRPHVQLGGLELSAGRHGCGIPRRALLQTGAASPPGARHPNVWSSRASRLADPGRG